MNYMGKNTVYKFLLPEAVCVVYKFVVFARMGFILYVQSFIIAHFIGLYLKCSQEEFPLTCYVIQGTIFVGGVERIRYVLPEVLVNP